MTIRVKCPASLRINLITKLHYVTTQRPDNTTGGAANLKQFTRFAPVLADCSHFNSF